MNADDEWRHLDGVDWLCVEPAQPRTADEAEPPTVEAGLVLAHGYAHESPAELGIGAAAFGALARELSRPRETSGPQVVAVQAAARVFLQDTIIRLAGSRDAVRLGLERLNALLSHPDEIDLADRPEPAEFGWHDWSYELTAWFGMGPVAWAAETAPVWSGDPEEARRLLTRSQPAREGRTVGWVTDPTVLPQHGDSPSTGSGRESVLRWREPSPVAAGPGAVVNTWANNLLSGRIGAGAVDLLALRLLARTLHRDLVEFRSLVGQLEISYEQVDADALFAVRALPGPAGFDAAATRAALLEALQTFAGLAEVTLADELTRARQAEALNVELAPGSRAIDAFRSGTRPGWSEVVAGYDALTVDDLRAACLRLLDHTLTGVADETTGPTSADPYPNPQQILRPLWLAPDLPKPGRPRIWRRALFPLGLEGAPGGISRLRANSQVLEVITTAPNFKGAVRRFAPQRRSVDLSSVAVRIDRGEAYTSLIDTDNRRFTITWPAFLRRRALRSLVDAATPPPVRVSAPVTEELSVDLRRRVTRARIGAVILAVVLIGFALLLFFHPVTGQNRAEVQQPLTSNARVGTAITLPNGTAITVSDPTWHAIENGNRQELDLTAEFCGGGETVAQNVDDNARNLVRVDGFSLGGLTPANRAVTPSGVGASSLAPAELARGQCVHGMIGFSVDATTAPSGGTVTYRNSAGDVLDWLL